MKLRCEKVLITGGGSGIGLAIAKRLLSLGASVVIAGRSAEKLEAARLEADSPCLRTMQWDVSDFAVGKSKIEEAAAMMDGLDGLVNNAAYSLSGRGWEPWDITPDEWDMSMNTNLKGAFFVMRDAVNYMLERQVRGNILNISSNASYMDIAGPYGAAKLALLKMTHTFGKRFGDKGIIINGIAPGATLTPMVAHYAKSIDQPYPRHAIGRFLRPDEQAELAAFLMSENGEILCGHTVGADGGDKLAYL